MDHVAQSQPKAWAAFAQSLSCERMHHATLLSGPVAEDLADFAQAMAASWLCRARTQAQACGQCPDCAKFSSNNHPDSALLAPNDSRKITVDSVRALIPRLNLKSHEQGAKVVRILGAHTMNPAAQNALLKTLEEPQGHVHFVLTTPQPSALLVTIRSRCQKLRLAPTTEQKGPDEDAIEELKPFFDFLASGTRVGPSTLLDMAAALGQDAESFQRTLEVLEHQLTHVMATAARTGDQSCLGRCTKVAQTLSDVRAKRAFNANRTMTLERVFLAPADA